MGSEMKLLTALKKAVPDRIFRRGKNYYNSGKIQDYNVIPLNEGEFRIEARVRGTTMYVVSIFLQIEGNHFSLYGNCSCPYNWGEICKHVVAVLYRFINEDYPELKRYGQSRRYAKLVELSRRIRPAEKVSLKYYLKGLLTNSMVNFKLTLKSEQLSEQELEDIISYINDPYYYNSTKVMEGLSYSDANNIEYLAKTGTTKSSTPGAILFPKNMANFSFLLNLLEKEQVYLDETGELAGVGEPLYPELEIEGDEDRIEIKPVKGGFPIYEHTYAEGRLAWTVIESRVHPVEVGAIRGLPDRIDIPSERKGEFLFEVLPSLKEQLSLRLADNLQDYELIKEEPVIKLQFDYQDDAIFCRSRVELAGNLYRNAEILGINLDDRHYQRDEENPKLWYCWDVEALKNLINFLEYNKFHVHSEGFIIKDENDIQDFITDGFLHLPEEWEVETTPAFDEVEIVPVELEPIIEFKEDGDKIDWFEFTVNFNLGGQSYSYSELKKLLRYNKQGEGYIRIGKQYFILQENEQQERVEEALQLAEEIGNDRFRSNYFNLLYYRKLVEEAGIQFKGNRVFNELDQDITGDKLVREIEIPREVEGVLRNYQKRGYYWFHFLDKYRFGGILADDMGLGKTLQTLTFLKSISREKPALIICPRTLIYNWGEEIEKFFPGTRYLVYYGTPAERKEMRANLADYELVISSYSIISRDYKELKEISFSYCILDEAQHIKNHRTKRARGVKQIKAGGRLALTGTPIENSVEELWSIMDFLMRGYLGNYNQFRKNYLQPIKNGDQAKLVELKKRVAPFILRRKKEEVLKELPEKLVNIYPVKMTRLQEDTYRVVLDEVKENLVRTVQEKGFDQARINVLAVLTKLRQICNHPALVLNKDQKQSSGKLEALLELVQDAIDGGHKLIVFSQFVKMLKLIRERFKEKGIDFEYLDGSTRNRMERVRRFNENEDIRVFLISLKAGGYGLNLTAADMVIHVDPWWNPMVERQASDRAHRIGQEKRVMVYKLITSGTVEEKMLKLQERKRHIFDRVIENNANPLDKITWEDIQELLEYGS
ncbi:MAG: hypothetical protein PWR10_842 [Halanaerobiales bacterium]|nr:hypothetical protein [Halanaerobiales bacterium]